MLSVTVCFGGEKPATLDAYFKSFARVKEQPVTDQWFSPDKGYHVIGAMIGTTLVGQLSQRSADISVHQSQIIGAGTMITLGALKEFHDGQKATNLFSWKDMAANGVGIVLGILLLGIH